MRDCRDNPYGGDPAVHTTSEGLLNGLAGGDPGQCERLVRLYGPWVYRRVAGSVRNGQDAVDVTHSAFVRIFSALRNYQRDGAEASFRRWLSGIIRKTIQEHYRRIGRQVIAPGGDALHDAIVQLEDREETDPAARQAFINLVHQAFEMIRPSFHERTLQAAWMVGIEHCPPAVVAERLGMSVGAVHTARCRVFQKLKETLRGEEPEGPGDGSE